MKKKFLNYSLNLINSSGKYDEEKLEEIAYGLETLYLTITKLVVLVCVSLLLGIFWEMIILLICYNVIRSSAFGIHASKSIYCLISSLSLFIGGVYISRYLATINIWIKIAIMVVSILLLLRYAPADTVKRPLINAKKRKKFKIMSVIKGVIYLILVILFRNHIISGYLICGMIEAILMILPLVYKIFNLPYDNYKKYNGGV